MLLVADCVLMGFSAFLQTVYEYADFIRESVMCIVFLSFLSLSMEMPPAMNCSRYITDRTVENSLKRLHSSFRKINK